MDLLKAARFEKIYLPCESIDDQYLRTLNRRHVDLEHFVRAAKMIEKAGFRMRNLEVNAFVLYGLPGEKIDQIREQINRWESKSQIAVDAKKHTNRLLYSHWHTFSADRLAWTYYVPSVVAEGR